MYKSRLPGLSVVQQVLLIFNGKILKPSGETVQLVNLRRICAWCVEESLIGDVKPSYASSTRRAIPKGGREASFIKFVATSQEKEV